MDNFWVREAAGGGTWKWGKRWRGERGCYCDFMSQRKVDAIRNRG